MYGTIFDPDLRVFQDAELLNEQGEYYANMLYAFRSVSRAIPATKETDAATKKIFNMRTFEVLAPEMDRLKELLTYAEEAKKFFVSVLSRMAGVDSGTTRDLFCEVLIKLLDTLQKIDNLKDGKACLQNDFAAYKRSFHLVRADVPAADIIQEDIQQLQMFLGNPYHNKLLVVNQLREQVKQVPKHEEVLLEMITICCNRIEKGVFVTPDEKYAFHRSLAYLIFMLDDPGKTTFNAFKARKLPLARVQKIIKRLPVIPETGDMTLSLPAVIALCPNYDKDKMEAAWGNSPLKAVEDHYDLRTHWATMREQHTEFTCMFAALTDTATLESLLAQVKGARKIGAVKQAKVDPTYIVENLKPLFDAVVAGVKLVSSWTCLIQEMSAWKFQHPASMEQMVARGYNPKDSANPMAEPFEKVVRYNFGKDELGVLTDCIAMIKSLAALITAKEANLAPAMRVYMHAYVQKFVSADLKPMVDKADKKGRPVGNFLKAIADLVADYTTAAPTRSVRKAMKELQSEKGHNARFVAPGAAQLHLLRCMVRSMNDLNGRGHYVSDSKDKVTMAVLEAFHTDTHYFPYMQSLSSTVQACNHLGDLWYRELFIEITKCTQFPIEMSLPFILTEHVVHNISGSVPLLENVAYILDVYNDAAFWALQTIQAQHLYDELEAEVNLVFDQATFLIGEEMYSHFKNAASSALLDTGYKTAIESGKGYAQLTVEEKRFSAVAEQHHILLLGRSIDLNFLIGTHLNHILLKDVSSVVKRFENSDLSNILEIEAMLQVVELTHTRLSTLLSLDPFEDMLQNANADVNAAHMCGKIVAHMKTTLLEDVVVNYALNMHTQRFVKSPVAFKQTGREGRPKLMQNNLGFGTQCGKAWDFYCNLSRGFVGRPHIEAMVRMVGEAGVNYITAFFMEHIEERINNTKSVLTGLSDGLPPIKLPKVSYGTAGCFGMFEARLKQYFSYMDFLDESFQVFREIGNVIALVGMLEAALTLRQSGEYVNAASFLGTRKSTKSEFAGVVRDPPENRAKGSPVAKTKRERAMSSVGKDRRNVIPNGKPVDHSAFEFKEIHASPMNGISQEFVETSHSHMSRIRAPKVISDFVTMTEKAQEAYQSLMGTPNLKIGKDLINMIAASIKRVGFDSPDGLGYDEGPETVMSSERTTEFHRLFSVLNFLLCMQHKARGDEGDDVAVGGQQPTTDGMVFGHGFGIAGVVMLNILNQDRKFQLLDLSYHVLKVHDQEQDMGWKADLAAGGDGNGSAGVGTGDSALDAAAKKFVAEAQAQQELHEHVIGMIDVQDTKEDRRAKDLKKEKFCYAPPDDDRDLKNLTQTHKVLLHKGSNSDE